MQNRFKKVIKDTRKFLTSFDIFGIPITVNYKGEKTYKTFIGFLFTFSVFVLIMMYSLEGSLKMLSREDPERAFYKLASTRPKDDALNLTDSNGQLYIGLSQQVEYKDGSSITSYIDMDPKYVGAKIDYYESRKLVARKNLELCNENTKNDFETKVNNTNGVTLSDFLVMRCIPSDTFFLYNVAGTRETNSFTLIFEQCGGKYAKTKEFAEVVEQQRQQLIAEGADPSGIPESDEWEWTTPNCDSEVESCEVPGLEETPEEKAASEALKYVYVDCDPDALPLDVDCVETWIFPSDCRTIGLYTCYSQMTRPPTCTLGDANCYVGFLRAMCASQEYQDEVCDTDVFQDALKKQNDCLPGQRKCSGFQVIFRGESSDSLGQGCVPWDFDCALRDYYGIDEANDDFKDYLLLYDMPKTSLSVEESDELDYLTELFYDNIWWNGLNSATLTDAERSKYYELGKEILTPEGFATFYQGLSISQKLQEQIDSQVRTFLAINRNRRLKTDFMPLTTITAIQFIPIIDWTKVKLDGSEAFVRGILYQEVQPDEIDSLYEAGADVVGDLDMFKSALYERKKIQTFQQERIDSQVKTYLQTNKRVAQVSFPWTKLTDEEFADILRAIQLTAGDDFDILLRGEVPPASFNEEVLIFSPDPLLLDPRQALIDHFTGSSPLDEEQQLIIDQQLRKFYEMNSQLVQIEKDQIVKVAVMPDTTLTVREHSELQRLQRLSHGDIFDRGLTGQDLSEADKEILLHAGEEMYGKEGINALYFQFQDITDVEQKAIDAHILTLINDLEKAQVAAMPQTTLTRYEIGQLDAIMAHKLGDLWLRNSQGDPTLTVKELKQVELAGREIMGSISNTDYKALYQTVNPPLTPDQQRQVDRKVRAFISAHKKLEPLDVITPIADIPGQPLTYLTQIENERIRYIMEVKTSHLWDQVFYPVQELRELHQTDGRSLLAQNSQLQYEQLSQSKKKILRKAGIELMGYSLFEDYLQLAEITSQEKQNQIDQKSQEFLAANTNIQASDRWENFAIIDRMPESVLLETDVTEINRLAQIMVPTFWNGVPPTFIDSTQATPETPVTSENQKIAVLQLASRIFGPVPADIGLQMTSENGEDFTLDEQGSIDEYATQFIAQYSADNDKLAKESPISIIITEDMMPFSTLTEVERARIDEILNEISGGIWRVFILYSQIELNRDQFNVARWAGEQWFQSRELLYRYKKGISDQSAEQGTNLFELGSDSGQHQKFTEEEQILIDERSRTLIEQFQDLDKVSNKEPFNAVAIIDFMPLTKITETLEESVTEILAYRLPNNLFERKFNPEFISDNLEKSKPLTEKQIQAIESVGKELFGSLDAYRQWEQRVEPFSTGEQTAIDAAWQAFASSYEEKDSSSIIRVPATIDKMPLSTLIDTEWVLISDILDFRLPGIYSLLREQEYSQLTVISQKAIYSAWRELLGGEAAQSNYVDLWLDNEGPDFDQEQQITIDGNIRQFLYKYISKKPEHVINVSEFRLLNQYLPKTQIALDEEDRIWTALEKIAKPSLAYDLFKLTKIDEETSILLSQEMQMERCYEQLFSPQGNHIINKRKAASSPQEISQDETDFIDAFMRELLKQADRNQLLDVPLETVRNKMPFTKLSIEQNRQLNWILEWKFAYEFDSRLDELFSQTFTEEELGARSDSIKAIDQIILDSIGEPSLEVFQAFTENFTEIQQRSIDEYFIKYIEANQGILFDQDQVLTDSKSLQQTYLFPWQETCDGNSCSSLAQTGLEASHMVQIKAIMSSYTDKRKIDIFEAYLNGRYDTLSERDKINLDYLLTQLYGGQENLDLMWKSINKEWAPSAEEFLPIKDAMLLFIQENLDGSTLKTIAAAVPYLPLFSQTLDEFWDTEVAIFKKSESLNNSLLLNMGWQNLQEYLGEESSAAESLFIEIFSQSAFDIIKKGDFIIDLGIRTALQESITAYLSSSRRQLSSEIIENESQHEEVFKYRRFRKLVKPVKKRYLQQEEDDQIECESEENIREYLKNKSIVVFATESFVKEEFKKTNQNEVYSNLAPLAEKRLDFRFHKNIGVQFEEIHILIQDLLVYITEPEPQEIILTQTKVISEDVVTRENWDGEKGEYVNSKEAMLSISFELLNSISTQKKTAYSILQLFGDIGGLFDFLYLIVTPLVGFFMGDVFSHIILKSLYMQNRSSDPSNRSNQNQINNEIGLRGPQSLRNIQNEWLQESEPYDLSFLGRFKLSRFYGLITCRSCRKNCCRKYKRSIEEKLEEKGKKRSNKGLDVRNLIKSQDNFKSVLQTVIPSKEKRKLLRLQRRNVVLEPCSSSSNSEDDFTIYKPDYEMFQKNFYHFDQNYYGQGDIQQLRLFNGVLERDALLKNSTKRRKGKRDQIKNLDNSVENSSWLNADDLENWQDAVQSAYERTQTNKQEQDPLQETTSQMLSSSKRRPQISIMTSTLTPPSLLSKTDDALQNIEELLSHESEEKKEVLDMAAEV